MQTLLDECLLKFRLKEQRYFVYPANFWRHKNHEMLLTAFTMARADKLPPDIKLVCTGSPDARMTEVTDAAKGLGLTDSVIFPGFLADIEFAALLRASAGVVFPSLYEGFGMPVIEAMAAGSPVACSNCASLPEIAGDAALLFDPRKPTSIAEAMVRLATDEELRADLIAKGLQQADQFSQVEQMAREYWAVFEHAARRKTDSLFVTGLYSDGWAAPLFSIYLPDGSSDRALRLEIEVPGWLPIREFDLTFTAQDQSIVFRATVKSGKQHLDVPLQEAAGRIDVQVRPFFRPCELPFEQPNPDTRPLTVMVSKIELHDIALSKQFVWPL